MGNARHVEIMKPSAAERAIWADARKVAETTLFGHSEDKEFVTVSERRPGRGKVAGGGVGPAVPQA